MGKQTINRHRIYRPHRRPKKRAGPIAFMALCSAVAVFSLVMIISILAQRGAAGQEYARLRELRPPQAPAPQSQAQPPATSAPMPDGSTASEDTRDPGQLAAINPDYVGWLSLPAAGIDYPVVRGADNSRYLNTTFEGATNPAGSIFMDCDSAANFSSQHTILYGHNMNDGSMFGALARYLDEDFLQANRQITVSLPEGGQAVYSIFAARTVSEIDPLYTVAFPDEAAFQALTAALGAPDAAGLLTLSTCTDDGNDAARVVVHAVRQ